MNKKDFYKLAGKLDCNGKATHEEVQGLYSLCLNLIDLVEDAQDQEGDIFGTEGWEHAIGWD